VHFLNYRRSSFVVFQIFKEAMTNDQKDKELLVNFIKESLQVEFIRRSRRDSLFSQFLDNQLGKLKWSLKDAGSRLLSNLLGTSYEPGTADRQSQVKDSDSRREVNSIVDAIKRLRLKPEQEQKVFMNAMKEYSKRGYDAAMRAVDDEI
jgi:hypothetical protein